MIPSRLKARYLASLILERTFVLLENKKRINALREKYPGIDTLYRFYDDHISSQYPGENTIKDTELNWVVKNFENIKKDYTPKSSNSNYILSLSLKNLTPPLDPTFCTYILKGILDFLKEKDALKNLLNDQKKYLSNEDLDKSKIFGPDINRYKSVQELIKAVSHVKSKDDILQSKADSSSSRELGVFNGYKIVVPQNTKESIAFDSNIEFKTTTWCTTRRTGQNLFDNYTLKGGILFYFTKESVSDEEAAKKKDGSDKYLNPYNRFCVGIGDNENEPAWPEKGKGYGDKIVDQDNEGIWKEKFDELLGEDSQKAIDAMVKYNKENEGQLPFARNFMTIIKSSKAVKDTIKNWTWPEQYDFLVSPRNKNSILELNNSDYEEDSKPGITTVKYAEKFKNDLNKKLEAIKKMPDSEEKGKQCWIAINKFKKEKICFDIIHDNLTWGNKESVKSFFDICFANPTLDYFKEKGSIQDFLINIYVKSSLKESRAAKDFDDWIKIYKSEEDPNLEVLKNIKAKAESSVCEMSKKQFIDYIENFYIEENISSSFLNVVADISLEENIQPDTIKKLDLIYRDILTNHAEIIKNDAKENIKKQCKDALKKIIENISKKIRVYSQSLDRKQFLSKTAEICQSEDQVDLIFKIYDSSNVIGSISSLNIIQDAIQAKNSTYYDSLKSFLIRSFFEDTLSDDDELNVQKLNDCVIQLPVLFMNTLKKFKSTNEIAVILAKPLVFEINSPDNNTTLQDFYFEKGKDIPAYSSIINAVMRKIISSNNTENHQEFLNRFCNSFNAVKENNIKTFNDILNNLGQIKEFDPLYNIFKVLISTDNKYFDSRDGDAVKQEKLDIFSRNLKDNEEIKFDKKDLLVKSIKENLNLHEGDAIGLKFLITENFADYFYYYNAYIYKNIESIPSILGLTMTCNPYQQNITFENFKRSYADLKGERLVFISGGFQNQFGVPDGKIKEYIDMINNASYTKKNKDIPEDFREFMTRSLMSIPEKQIRSLEDLKTLALKIKNADINSFNTMKEYMVEKMPEATSAFDV